MRKIDFLKRLVDFTWYFICIPVIFVCLIGIIQAITNNNSQNFLLLIDIEVFKEQPEYYVRIFVLIYCLLVLIGTYSIYLFRSTIKYFMKEKPFHENVINNFNRIGRLLVFLGIASIVLIFISGLLFFGKFKFSLGANPYFFIICFGVFFMVLSEVFKIAKKAKQENELTI